MTLIQSFIKHGKTVIAPILCQLYNARLMQGVFPQYLKVAEVISIHKKGDKNKSTNYCPISLLSQFDKILEKIIYNRLTSYLDKYNLLSKKQFGFRKN